MFMFLTIILLGLNRLNTLGSILELKYAILPFFRKLNNMFIALILRAYSGFMLITDTKEARKESIRLLEALGGS